MQYLGFGSGKDGLLSITSNTTEAPVDSSCSGTAATTSLTATNASFADDDMILIHQSRGTNAGSWELNFIDSYVAGTITTLFDLVNTYADSGANQAQVREVPEYTGVTIDSGVTYSAKTWDGNVGGIMFFVCSGHVQVNGTISVQGKGYQRGDTPSYSRSGTSATNPMYGEGTLGAAAATTGSSSNGSGGGAGQGGDGGSAGGGGGHAASGSTGQTGQGSAGSGGSSSGSADMSTMTFGGAGGGGKGESNANCVPSNTYYGGRGGSGGGIFGCFTYSITVDSSTGSINCNGNTGESSNGGCEEGAGGGGGGAGGSCFIKCVEGAFNTNRITATPGSGGSGTGSFHPAGGTGANGRIRIESCNHTGSTNPSASESKGGHDFCQSFIHIYG